MSGITRRQLLEAGGAAAALGLAAGAAGAEASPAGVAENAWRTLVNTLGEVGAEVAKLPDPLDRAEGMRAVTRNLSLGLDRFLEYADPDRPSFFPLQGFTRKFAGDNPDQRYHGAPFAGDRTYRITGNRGNSILTEIGVYAGNFFGGGERRIVAFATEAELEFAEDGSIEVTLSPEAAPAGARNWIRTDADASSLLVREYFEDPLDKRSDWKIERVPAAPPAAPLDEAAIARALQAVAGFTKTVLFWGKWIDGVKARGTNVLNPLRDEGDLQTPDGVRYHQGHWKLGPEEALVIELTPADVPYWGLLIMNRWMESLEYRERSVAINKFQAKLEPDGRLRVIVAHRDPGHANWLDTAGHSEGLMSLRWARLEAPLPDAQVRVVPFETLAAELA